MWEDSEVYSSLRKGLYTLLSLMLKLQIMHVRSLEGRPQENNHCYYPFQADPADLTPDIKELGCLPSFVCYDAFLISMWTVNKWELRPVLFQHHCHLSAWVPCSASQATVLLVLVKALSKPFVMGTFLS